MIHSTEVGLLVVEDDPIDQEAIIRSLRRMKVANEIVTAGDGVEALEILRGTGGKTAMPRPCIVLLDFNLPRMTGPEFLAELREDKTLADTIVFVLTSSADAADIDIAYQHNVAGYIVKSRVGSDFVRLIELLETFWRIVELPSAA